LSEPRRRDDLLAERDRLLEVVLGRLRLRDLEQVLAVDAAGSPAGRERAQDLAALVAEVLLLALVPIHQELRGLEAGRRVA